MAGKSAFAKNIEVLGYSDLDGKPGFQMAMREVNEPPCLSRERLLDLARSGEVALRGQGRQQHLPALHSVESLLGDAIRQRPRCSSPGHYSDGGGLSGA